MARWPFRDRKSVYAHLYHSGCGHFHIFGHSAIEKDQQLSIRSFPVFFLTLLLVGLGLLFFGHSWFLESQGLDPYGNQLVKSYLLNVAMASMVFFAIYFYRNKYRDLLGFFFLGGSLIKFVLFFIFLYPGYNQDGILERMEFLAFFVPYLFSLFLETYFLVKLLNTVWKSPRFWQKNQRHK